MMGVHFIPLLFSHVSLYLGAEQCNKSTLGLEVNLEKK